jgi:hypothetical protein
MDPEIRYKLIELVMGVAKKEGKTGLKEAWGVVRDVWDETAKRETMKIGEKLVPGVTKVQFVARGMMIKGVVMSVNDKTITVKEDNGHRWRVGPSLLKVIGDGHDLLKVAGDGTNRRG